MFFFGKWTMAVYHLILSEKQARTAQKFFPLESLAVPYFTLSQSFLVSNNAGCENVQ